MSLGGLYLEGLIHGGAYFRNFTVHQRLTLYRKTPLMEPIIIIIQFSLTEQTISAQMLTNRSA